MTCWSQDSREGGGGSVGRGTHLQDNHVNYAGVILSISNVKLAQTHHCVVPMAILVDWKHKYFVAKHISILQGKRQVRGIQDKRKASSPSVQDV